MQMFRRSVWQKVYLAFWSGAEGRAPLHGSYLSFGSGMRFSASEYAFSSILVFFWSVLALPSPADQA
jgi:hypothetical protein